MGVARWIGVAGWIGRQGGHGGVLDGSSEVAGADALDDFGDGLAEDVEVGLGVDADPDGPGDQGDEEGDFARGHVGDGQIFAVGHLAEHGALVEPQEVRGAQDHTGDGEGGPDGIGLEGALHDGELADEAVEQRQAGRAEHGDGEDDGELGHDVREAAVFFDFACVAALVNDADDEEEHAGGEPVIDLLQDGAGDAVGVHGEDAEGTEAQVAHRGIGDQFFPVGLHQADERSVNDADDGEDGQNLHDLLVHRGLGQEREGEAQEAIGPHFQEHGGEDHGARGGRLHVGVGQPGVEGEHRDLDGEADEEGPEDPLLGGQRQIDFHQLADLKRVEAELVEVGEIEGQDAEQHEHAARQGVQEELDGGVEFSGTAPDADDEVHGD